MVVIEVAEATGVTEEEEAAMAEAIEVHAVDTVAVTEAVEAMVETETEVHVVDMPVVETAEEVVVKVVAHVVAIAALVAHADVRKVAAEEEISNHI